MRAKVIIVFFSMLLLSCSSLKKSKIELKNLETKITISVVQYKIEGNKTFDELVNKIKNFVFKAKQKKSDLILFPELVALDIWPVKSKEKEGIILESIANYWPKFKYEMIKLSKEHDIIIVAGSAPRMSKGDLYNTSLTVLPNGKTYEQDKMTLTPWGKSNKFEVGKDIVEVKTRFGKILVLICYDIESPKITKKIISMFPEIILVPSMTESDEGFRRVKFTAQARAIEHHAYVVVSSTVGEVSPGWKNIGQASVYNPQYPGYPEYWKLGKKDKSGIVTTTLDLSKLRKSRSEKKHYPAIEKLK